MASPVLLVLAGPNGAGKSTLYEAFVRPRFGFEFVNADLLAQARLGRPAQTDDEARWGQAAAEARRIELLEAKASFVMESTFSHPSKVELVRDAVRRGYVVTVLHVNVGSGDHAVERVRHRVARGGHPVPEDRIRGRYARNGAIIREALLLADRGLVFDNSGDGQRPRLLLFFGKGKTPSVLSELPPWAAALYGADIGQAR